MNFWVPNMFTYFMLDASGQSSNVVSFLLCGLMNRVSISSLTAKLTLMVAGLTILLGYYRLFLSGPVKNWAHSELSELSSTYLDPPVRVTHPASNGHHAAPYILLGEPCASFLWLVIKCCPHWKHVGFEAGLVTLPPIAMLVNFQMTMIHYPSGARL